MFFSAGAKSTPETESALIRNFSQPPTCLHRYLLLEAASGGKFTDDEDDGGEVTEVEKSDTGESSDEDDDDFFALAEAKAKAAGKSGACQTGGQAGEPPGAPTPLPRPPPGLSGEALGILGSGMARRDRDPFRKVAEAFKAKAGN